MRTTILCVVAIVLSAVITTTLVRTGTECGACPSVAEVDAELDRTTAMAVRIDHERRTCIDDRIGLQALLANIDQESRADERAKLARERTKGGAR